MMRRCRWISPRLLGDDAPEQPSERSEGAKAEQRSDGVGGEVGIFPREIGIVMPRMRVHEVWNDRQQADGNEGAQSGFHDAFSMLVKQLAGQTSLGGEYSVCR